MIIPSEGSIHPSEGTFVSSEEMAVSSEGTTISGGKNEIIRNTEKQREAEQKNEGTRKRNGLSSRLFSCRNILNVTFFHKNKAVNISISAISKKIKLPGNIHD